MLMSQSFKYQIWGQFSVMSRYIYIQKYHHQAHNFAGKMIDCLLLTNAMFGLMEAPKTWIWKHFIYLHRSFSSGCFYGRIKKAGWRLQNQSGPTWIAGSTVFSVWKKKLPHSKVVVFWVDLEFLEVSPMSSCSEIVVSSNNSTRPKFALSSLAEAIQVHRFKGKFDATASSKIAVPLMAKAISTASLG